jgi:hypothetical protein
LSPKWRAFFHSLAERRIAPERARELQLTFALPSQRQRMLAKRFAQIESGSLAQPIEKGTNCAYGSARFGFQQDAYHPDDARAHSLSSVPSISLIQKNQE